MFPKNVWYTELMLVHSASRFMQRICKNPYYVLFDAYKYVHTAIHDF